MTKPATNTSDHVDSSSDGSNTAFKARPLPMQAEYVRSRIVRTARSSYCQAVFGTMMLKDHGQEVAKWLEPGTTAHLLMPRSLGSSTYRLILSCVASTTSAVPMGVSSSIPCRQTHPNLLLHILQKWLFASSFLHNSCLTHEEKYEIACSAHLRRVMMQAVTLQCH